MRLNDKVGKFHRHKWVNYEDLVLAIMTNTQVQKLNSLLGQTENGPLLTTDVKQAKDKTILSLLVSIKIKTKCKSNLEDNINMLSNSK